MHKTDVQGVLNDDKTVKRFTFSYTPGLLDQIANNISIMSTSDGLTSLLQT